ncbi:hypothetical protein ACJIZ3_009489 [Penstemon smallii]|uniref:DUF7356 domain-containing protein n=1 Tax=Penstemon smallii TaxID=265156 RepID=A0ABD3TEX5_9LAMI
MKCLSLTLLLIFSIFVVPSQSSGYFLERFRKLAHDNHNSNATVQISPSTNPVGNLNSGNAQSPLNSPKGVETCEMVFSKCEIKDYNLTACVPFVGNGSHASYVLVVNAGNNSFQLNITLLPANTSVEHIAISGHQVKKVNLPSTTRGNSAISLNVGNGDCIIHTGVVVPQGLYLYTNYLTPTNGTYLLFVTALFIGGTLACCKLRNRERHLNGVPYKELEMRQKESNVSSFTIGTPESNWDQNWDVEDWDEENAMRSPGTKFTEKKLENGGASLKYIDTAQWGNGWDN